MASRAVYLLWQCDPTQSTCHIIFSKRIPTTYTEDEYRAAKTKLDLDSQTGEIEVILDGEIIYSYGE